MLTGEKNTSLVVVLKHWDKTILIQNFGLLQDKLKITILDPFDVQLSNCELASLILAYHNKPTYGSGANIIWLKLGMFQLDISCNILWAHALPSV